MVQKTAAVNYFESLAALQQTEKDIAELRAMTMEQRAALLDDVCRQAAELEAWRIEAGQPPSTPAVVPDSTITLMRKHMDHVRESRKATG